MEMVYSFPNIPPPLAGEVRWGNIAKEGFLLC